ncbi:MAG: kelch repeat-containing protein, partial [Acidimicrobiales bacterium]
MIESAMAFDQATGQMILVGSVSGDEVLETWSWNGTNWTELSPSNSPSPRFGESLAYDGATDQLVLFGGQSPDGSTLYNDTWLWDGTDWSNVTPGSGNPLGRYGASMVYDPSTSQFILYAGNEGEGDADDTWEWTGTEWNGLEPAQSPSVGRAFAAASYDPVSQQIIVFGGSGYADTWGWNGSTWNQLTPEYTPGASYGASMADDAATGQVIYYGGDSTEDYQLDDTFDWDGSKFDNLNPPNSPEALANAAMAYDPDSSQLVMFGGYNGTSYVSDTWVYGVPAPASTCTGFSDNFQGSTLSSDWETQTPLVSAVASDLSDIDAQPSLDFPGSGMEVEGADEPNHFVGIQSVTACQGPFTFKTSVEGQNSYGSPFLIYLVSADQSEAVSVEGDLDPSDGGYGIWASSTLGAAYGESGSTDIFSSPATGFTYDVSVSVDETGNATVALSGPGISTPIVDQVGNVGTDPLYAVIGQRSNFSDPDYPNEAFWSDASLNLSSGVTASITTSSPTVNGVETVPESAISTSSVTGSTNSGSGDAASAPLSSIPLSSIGLDSSPLSSIPLSSIPLSSIAAPGGGSLPSGIQAAEQALESTLLSDLSITYPAGCGPSPATACTGWEGVLNGTPYENVPLEAVTLANVLDNATSAANLDTVDVGDLDLSSSPLSSIPLSSIDLGSTPLSSIGLGGTETGYDALQAWCAELGNPSIGFSCSDFGIGSSDSTTDVTLLALALAGVPLSSIPLSSIPLSSIDLASSPLSSIPLSSIDLGSNPLSSIPLSSIPLSSIPLSSIPLSSIGDLSAVVDCSTYPDCASGTLGDAYTAGVILPGATLADLSAYNGTTLGQLLNGDTTDTPGYPTIDLGDLILSTVPPASYQWQAVDLPSLPLASDESGGGTVTYNVNLTVSNSESSPTVTVTLPESFAYVTGTS